MISSRQIRMRSFPQWSMGGSLKTPPIRAIFRRHALERIHPATLTAPAILLLMMDLQDLSGPGGGVPRRLTQIPPPFRGGPSAEHPGGITPCQIMALRAMSQPRLGRCRVRPP